MGKAKHICMAIAMNFAASLLWSQQVRIVNMIPNAQSNETAQDRETTLAINPANARQIVGLSFTPNPMGATMPPSAPIFISLDGGQTWLLNASVPSNSQTNDITAKFGTTTGWLYTSILRLPSAAGAARTMDILRTNNFTGPALMQQILTRNQPDQPYVYAVTPTTGAGTGIDRLYVGNNDLGVTPRSATVDQSLNASATTPTLANNVVERRAPFNQDGPPVRLAIHSDGTIYGAYIQRTASAGTVRTANVIVLRDDNWASGATVFSNLTDPSDGLAGRIVIAGIQFQFGTTMGAERLGDRVQIAVDPNNSNVCYIAWGDNNGTGAINLHLRRSINRGVTWSAADLRTINGAINPEIAINSLGEVAFSYQQLVTGNWQSVVERTINNFTTQTVTVLNTFPDGTPPLPPAGGSNLYLGDYCFLSAMPSGKDFFGAFSASNDPNPVRFPTVQPVWQRNIDATTNQLRNLTNTSNVAISMDPYYYRVSPVPLTEDFYVRDWTSSTTDRDPGDEPSSNPVFYLTSDVWNRRSNTPGAFNANDQPANQDPRPTTAGHNFAYARVHRRTAGPAATVNLLFLKSEFGTGSNYQLANGVSSFTSLPFSATDVQLTMASGVQWDLVDPAAVTANHVCMAVEIAGPNDPSGNPTLLGRAPGWSNGTDLLVLSDNNKAQRNLQVYTGPDDGAESMTMYAVAHNAALLERDMKIVVNPYSEKINRKKFNVSVVSSNKESRSFLRGDTLVLSNMHPCENRWIALTVNELPALESAPIEHLFEERVHAMKINGFGIGVRSAKLDVTGEEYLGEHAFAFGRLGKEFNVADAEQQSKAALQLIDAGVNESNYIAFLEKEGGKAVQIVKDLLSKTGNDPFGLSGTLTVFVKGVKDKEWKKAAIAHGNLVRKLNAYLSFLDKSEGDVADIIQTVRWYKDILRRGQVFKGSNLSGNIIIQLEKFIDEYSARNIQNNNYPPFVEKQLPSWMELVKTHLPNHNFDPFFNRMKEHLKDPQKLQKSHCELVMELNRVARTE